MFPFTIKLNLINASLKQGQTKSSATVTYKDFSLVSALKLLFSPPNSLVHLQNEFVYICYYKIVDVPWARGLLICLPTDQTEVGLFTRSCQILIADECQNHTQRNPRLTEQQAATLILQSFGSKSITYCKAFVFNTWLIYSLNSWWFN